MLKDMEVVIKVRKGENDRRSGSGDLPLHAGGRPPCPLRVAASEEREKSDGARSAGSQSETDRCGFHLLIAFDHLLRQLYAAGEKVEILEAGAGQHAHDTLVCDR